MAIPSGAYQTVVETAETAITTTASIADGGFTNASNATITVIDNSADGYPLMDIEFNGVMSATPVDGDVISFYLRRIGIFGGTDNENAPDANNEDGFLASIPLDTGSTAQVKMLSGVPIPRGKFELYFKADGEAVNSGAVVKIQRYSGNAAP